MTVDELIQYLKRRCSTDEVVILDADTNWLLNVLEVSQGRTNSGKFYTIISGDYTSEFNAPEESKELEDERRAHMAHGVVLARKSNALYAKLKRFWDRQRAK